MNYISYSDRSHTIHHIAFYLSWIRNRIEELVISSVCQPDTSSVKWAILNFLTAISSSKNLHSVCIAPQQFIIWNEVEAGVGILERT